MKSHIHFLFVLLLAIGNCEWGIFAQDPIDEYEGIPLVIYPALRAEQMLYPLHYQQMKDMGVFAVVAPDVFKYTPGMPYLQRFKNYGLKVIPAEIWSDTIHNQIFRYADSHYSIWQAEGVMDTINGKASLIRSSNTTVSEGNVIASPLYTPDGDTIIKGPGYIQHTKYRLSDDTVKYHIEYRMRITETGPPPYPPQDYLDDIVCKVMVTTIATDTSSEVPVLSKEVKVSDFGGWNNWVNIDTIYNLAQYSFDMSVRQGGDETDSWWLPISYYVQFKIVWAGLDYLNLYIDRIKVYDDFGLDLIEGSQPKLSIQTLVEEYLNDETIIGWYAVDEPGSIDNYEPYRVVDQIVDSVSNLPQNNFPIRLHAAITGSWRGTYAYGNYNYDKAHDVFVADEFWLRAKPKNLQMNLYNYNYPWKAGEIPEWREANIAYVTDLNLDRINNYDTSFAFSTQAGGWYFYDEECEIVKELIIPSPVE